MSKNYDVVGLTIEHAALENEQRVLRGVANTFGVMRSGRMIHPTALDGWLARNADAGLPLLAQHGYVDGFATIGRVTSLKVTKRGLEFTAALAQGVKLADEAWTLVQQRMLDGFSLGWQSIKSKYAQVDEPSLDDAVGKALKKAGKREAMVHYEIEPVEISLVDVGDDAAARRVADANGLRETLDGLRTLLAELKAEHATAQPVAGGLTTADVQRIVDAAFDKLSHDLASRVVELTEAAVASLGAAYGLELGGYAGDAAEDDPSADPPPSGAAGAPQSPLTPDEVARLRATLAKLPA